MTRSLPGIWYNFSRYKIPWKKALSQILQFMHCTCTCQFPWIQNSKLHKIQCRNYNLEEKTFAWWLNIFHWCSNNLSIWSKTYISSISDCHWFLAWKSAQLPLNWIISGSVTTFKSCWICRYIICSGATCRSWEHFIVWLGKRDFIFI